MALASYCLIAATLMFSLIFHLQTMEAFESQAETEEERGVQPRKQTSKGEKEPSRQAERLRYLEPPISIQSRHYSLEPDCVGGWKPKRHAKPKPKYVNVFPLRYDEEIVDEIVRELARNKAKHNEALIYVGPRRQNSFQLHQNRSYPNPYTLNKAPEPHGKTGVSYSELRSSYLSFNSDFESGNLDAVVQTESCEFELFMRVDSNTRGHTNWFYFEVQNGVFIGRVTFKICNFRRPHSLYQRGLKPYVWSREKKDGRWTQQGEEVRYERQRLRYRFLYGNGQDAANPMLSSYYALTFAFKFQQPHDLVKFAYCPPYPYSQLNQFLNSLSNTQKLPPFKSLSGLPIPVLKITSDDQEDASKKVVLVTARIHPGESNSSFVAEGFLEAICGGELGRQLRGKYIFYVIPMLNPDGVVAGNYRTSLFGKDLNRTFDQSRRFAFPEVYQLLRLGEQLKQEHKKRFCLYLDLHGHSIKKNVFMYGPDYSLQDHNYDISRQLPKLLANVTSYFRYYSCSFRISDSKASTGRAVFNRALKIPYTYTMESSNGCYYDALTHNELPFTVQSWKEMGGFLAQALSSLHLDKLPKIARTHTLKIKKLYLIDDKHADRMSDDEINEDDSDMEPLNEDLPDEILNQIETAVKGDFADEEDHVKSVDATLHEQPLSDKKKKKKRARIQDLIPKGETKVLSDSKVEAAREVFAFQVPERKNISFPVVFPAARAEIFMNRQSRHDKYEKPLQLRLRKNETQSKRPEASAKISGSSHKIAVESDRELSGEVLHKQELHLHDLIKKYKFNF